MLLLLLACRPAADTLGFSAPLALPGVPPIASSSPRVHPLPDRVIIIGAGVAGMSAAIEARARGAHVIVLERETGTVGGAANEAALMMFSGSAEEADAGVTDSPEQLLSEWPAITDGDISDDWVQRFANENVPAVHDWLAAMGVGWGPPVLDPSAGTTPRIHLITGGGEELVDVLHAQLPEGVIRMGVEATGLVQEASGRVTGVHWRDVQTGEVGLTEGRGVVVATGGFGRNLDTVREARPELAEVVLTHASWAGADGNGLDMLRGLGAATQNLGAIGLYAHSSRCPSDPLEEMGVPFQFAVPWVDALGRRFVDESVMNDLRTAESIVDHGGAAWMVFDPDALTGAFVCGDGAESDRLFTLTELVDEGFAHQEEDLLTLGGALGVDPQPFSADIEAYNEAIYAGAGDVWRPDLTGAMPVDTAPYFAMPVAVCVAKMFGGVDVDLDGRVLTTDGHVIRGLYAAGELTGMAGGSLVGDAGFTGSLSAVVLGGRVAGEHAATDRVVR